MSGATAAAAPVLAYRAEPARLFDHRYACTVAPSLHDRHFPAGPVRPPASGPLAYSRAAGRRHRRPGAGQAQHRRPHGRGNRNLLLGADVGVEATTALIDDLNARLARHELADGEAVLAALKARMRALLAPCEVAPVAYTARPHVILMVGVNGAGKTTTIAKLARRLIGEGRQVVLAAGDTFRAAAVEQLKIWASVWACRSSPSSRAPTRRQ